MNYQEALQYIHSTYKFGSKLGLENITYLLNLLGNPQKDLKCIHVAGTNGKGSTCTMLSYVLTDAGFKTGLFTSPYLEDFRERIQIDNELMEEDELVNSVSIVKAAIERMIKDGRNHPTEFEIVTAIAFYYFNLKQVDLVILEVGMGGRLDATNVIQKPEVVVITSISKDHSEYLGDTVELIAYEKASIIKKGCQVVVYPQKGSVYNVIREIAFNNISRIHQVDKNHIEILAFGPEGQKLKYLNPETNTGIDEFDLSLIGAHQSINSLTVLKTLEILINKGYNISKENILNGMKTVKFMGRMEILSRNPMIIIDGAHNPDGIANLSSNIRDYFSGYNVHLFFGMLADKDISSSIKMLMPYCKSAVTLTPNNSRAQKAEDTAEMFRNLTDMEVTSCDDIEGSTELIKTGENDVNIFCGSLYMIGDARRAINEYLNK
jgi:dihydrofolate synthase/folylpolyglutamate synthase